MFLSFRSSVHITTIAVSKYTQLFKNTENIRNPIPFDVKLSYQPKISLNKKKGDSLWLILHQIPNK